MSDCVNNREERNLAYLKFSSTVVFPKKIMLTYYCAFKEALVKPDSSGQVFRVSS